jgi:hypothetical protein
MTLEEAIQVVCPRCRQADAVQQVKRLLDEGPPAGARSNGDRPAAAPLEERLRYAGNLASREIGAMPAGCTVALGAAIPLAVVGAGIVLALLLSRWGYPRAVSLPVGGIVVLAGIMGVINMLQQLPGFTRKAEEDRAAYLEAKAKDETAFTRWQNELYYCSRDDCVFLPEQPHCVPPEQMHVLLYA